MDSKISQFKECIKAYLKELEIPYEITYKKRNMISREDYVEIEFYFVIKGTNYIIILNDKANNSFIFIKETRTKDRIYGLDKKAFKNKEIDEIVCEIKKEIKKLQLKNIFNTGPYKYTNKLFRNATFTNLNVNKEKLRIAIKEKLKIKTDDDLELDASRVFNLDYKSSEKNFSMVFLKINEEIIEEVKIFINLNEVVKN